MSLLLLNLVYVKQADSERLGRGRAGRGGIVVVGGPRSSNRRDGVRRKQECHFSSSFLLNHYCHFLFLVVVVVFFGKCICHHGVNRCSLNQQTACVLRVDVNQQAFSAYLQHPSASHFTH